MPARTAQCPTDAGLARDSVDLEEDVPGGVTLHLAVAHERGLRSGQATRKTWATAEVALVARAITILAPRQRLLTLRLEGCTIHHSRLEHGLLGIRFPHHDEQFLFRGSPEGVRSLFCELLASTQGRRRAAGMGRSDRHLRKRYSDLHGALSPCASKRRKVSTLPQQHAGSPGAQPDTGVVSQLEALTKEQRDVCDAVLTGKSIFFTGGAGTGKSFLLKKLVEILPPADVVTTASTAMAASQIGGTTIHRWAGIGLGEGDVLALAHKLKKRRDALQRWRQCRVLIIDEISMVSGQLFEVLEVLARAIRGNDDPFGGIQLVACGDFLQLPPVVKAEDQQDGVGRSPTFCFEVKAWKRTVCEAFELTEIFRQKGDATFCELLNEVRFASISDQYFDLLKRRLVAGASPFDPTTEITRLMPLRSEVDSMNERALASLPGELVCFEAIDDGNQMDLDSFSGARRSIDLRAGALVVLTRTIDAHRKLVNGSQGRILRFEGGGSMRFPVVSFKDAQAEILVSPVSFEAKCGNRFLGARSQVPLELGWAMSIHKSQGLTLGNVEVNIRTVFEHSQAYVALSRARSLNGLVLIGDETDLRKCIKADPRCIRFHKEVSTVAAHRRLERGGQICKSA